MTGDSRFDLIICGKQTTDGDTAQVGPAIAEYLGIPHTAWVGNVAGVTEESIVVEQDLVNITQKASMDYPCLITVEKDIYTPRLPSYKLKAASKDRPVHILTFKDFKDQNEKNYGLSGSATNVERIFPPAVSDDHIYYEGDSIQKAQQLLDMLSEKKYI